MHQGTSLRSIDAAARVYDWAQLPRALARMYLILPILFVLSASLLWFLPPTDHLVSGPEGTPVRDALTDFGLALGKLLLGGGSLPGLVLVGAAAVLAWPIALAAHRPKSTVFKLLLLLLTAALFAPLMNAGISLMATGEQSNSEEGLLRICALSVSLSLFVEVIWATLVLVKADRSTIKLTSERGYLAVLGLPAGINSLRGTQRIAVLAMFVIASVSASVAIVFIIRLPQLALEYWAATSANGGILSLRGIGIDFARVNLLYTLLLTAGLYLLALLVRRSAERKCILSGSKAMAADTRPPILFLRAFEDDRVAMTPAGRTPLRFLISRLSGYPSLDRMLVEQFSNIGPTIAIGMPGDRERFFGVNRTYVSDDEWQSEVTRLAAAARAIVLVADCTDGVAWEIKNVAARWKEKTIIMAPRKCRSSNENDRLWTFVETNLGSPSAKGASEPVLAAFYGLNAQLLRLTSHGFCPSCYLLALRLFLDQGAECDPSKV